MQTTKENKQRLHRVSVDVSEDIHNKIKSLEKSRQTTQSEIIRKAVYLMFSLEAFTDAENRVAVVDKSGQKLSDIIFM